MKFLNRLKAVINATSVIVFLNLIVQQPIICNDNILINNNFD